MMDQQNTQQQNVEQQNTQQQNVEQQNTQHQNDAPQNIGQQNAAPQNAVLPNGVPQNAAPQKEKKKRRISVLSIILLVLCIVFFIGNLFWLLIIAFIPRGSDTNYNIKGQLSTHADEKLEVLKDAISDYYMYDYDEADLEEGVYQGFINALGDPYSQYYTAEEYAQLLQEEQGEYYGIGALLLKNEDTGYVEITNVYDDSPAQEGGLRIGDIFISVDGEPAVDMDVADFASKVRGPEGTQVDLVYLRDGKEYEITLTRRAIERPSVEYRMLDGNVGYIQITEFIETTADEFEEAVSDLEAQGMQAVIYDLRNNPGGLVNAVTDILDQILPEGVTVYMEDKNGNREDYTSEEKSQLSYPTVVLVNENSASSSEIFAGAIKDFEWGTLLGTKTFGKGIVQTILEIDDGSAIKMTYASYFSPNGTNIHGEGIEPDVELEYDYSGDVDEEWDYTKDNQVQKALEILRKQ